MLHWRTLARRQRRARASRRRAAAPSHTTTRSLRPPASQGAPLAVFVTAGLSLAVLVGARTVPTIRSPHNTVLSNKTHSLEDFNMAPPPTPLVHLLFGGALKGFHWLK